MLYLFNTSSRRKVAFTPLQPQLVTIYSCGPTVYARQHLGNMRPYVFADVLRRTLELLGYDTKHVINITDVGHLTDDADAGEDKLELAARAERRSAWEIAGHFAALFWQDLDRLAVRPPHVCAHATDHIADQIELTQRLERGGFTYRTADGIYFDTSRTDGAGTLSPLASAEKQAQNRVIGTAAKRRLADFALWKFSRFGERRQMEWESPWGVGFPGWHTECAAMATKYLGTGIDIHTGGIDHIPVHHENEILQVEAAFGVRPWVQTWLHCEWVMFGGTKIAKRDGLAPSLDDVIARGVDPLVYRFLLLGGHYRSKINFSWKTLESAARAFERLRSRAARLAESVRLRESVPSSGPQNVGDAGYAAVHPLEAFREALADDLNTPHALAILFGVFDADRLSPEERYGSLRVMDAALGLGLTSPRTGLDTSAAHAVQNAVDDEAQALLEARQRARLEKDWALADRLRMRLAHLGYRIEDTPEGVRLKR